jgi:hypothetical protein
MKKPQLLAAMGLVLALAACHVPSSPVGNEDQINVQGTNEIDANTAVSVYGPEGNASNAAAAALTPSREGSPDYNVAGLDARHDEERGNLGGRAGE